MTMGPIKSKTRPPIVDHQGDIRICSDGVEPGIEVAAMVDEAVRACCRRSGATHTHQVRGEAASGPGEMRDDVAPKIRRGWVAVEKDDRVAVATGVVAAIGM